MDVTVLGSSGSSARRGNPASGYLISHRDTTVMVDAGPGTFQALMDHTDPGRLDAVCVSHVHPDHCLDVVALYGYLAHGPGGTIPVAVYCPEGVIDVVAAFLRADPDHALFRTLDFRVVGAGDRVDVGDIEVTFAHTRHPVPTVAMRFAAGGRSLAYSADTGPGGGFPDLAAGADVVLCEATLSGNDEGERYPYHLTAAEAGEVAAAAGATRLILTHLSSTLRPEAAIRDAAETFGREPELAVAGMTFTI